jgi:undecaprenyl pyrophosphate phosphatase UppP
LFHFFGWLRLRKSHSNPKKCFSLAHQLSAEACVFVSFSRGISSLLRENAEIPKHRAVQGRQALGTPVFPARCPGKAFFWAFLSGMSEPLGGLLAWLVLKESWGEGWREGCGKLVHHLFQRI